MLVAVSIVGVLLHVLMDLPTSYGTRLLSPFDWHWFAVDWMPIVDIYLLMALVIGLLGRSDAGAAPRQGRVRAAADGDQLRRARRPPIIRRSRSRRACSVRRCRRRAIRRRPPPPIVDRWPRAAAPSSPPPGKRCLVEMIAMPSFTSPFSWRIIAQMSNAYEIHDIDLLDRQLPRAGDADRTHRGGPRSGTRTCGRRPCCRRRRRTSVRCFSGSRGCRRRDPRSTPTA